MIGFSSQMEFDEKDLRREISYAIKNIHGVRQVPRGESPCSVHLLGTTSSQLGTPRPQVFPSCTSLPVGLHGHWKVDVLRPAWLCRGPSTALGLNVGQTTQSVCMGPGHCGELRKLSRFAPGSWGEPELSHNFRNPAFVPIVGDLLRTLSIPAKAVTLVPSPQVLRSPCGIPGWKAGVRAPGLP